MADESDATDLEWILHDDLGPLASVSDLSDSGF